MDRETFESLTPEEQARIFSETPLTEKSELILLAHEPGRLTQGLSAEELYLMTRDLDREEKAEILRLAGTDQLAFMADMDCWQGDQIAGAQFVGWLGTLLEADESAVLRWMHHSDYEAIIAGFQKFASVLKPDWETNVDEIVGDQPYFTLDRMYYILVAEENFETVKRVIEVLYENDRPRYFALLEGVLGEMDYEMEEDAYSNRERRLADRGFPDFETAVRALIPLDLEGFRNFPKKEKTTDARETAEEGGRPAAPRYLVLSASHRLFLDDALLALEEGPDSLREGVFEELAWLCNKMIVCAGMDFTSQEKVRRAVDRVRSLVSLGLELLSGGDLSKASEILSERWVEAVFRYALSELHPLRDRVRALIRSEWKGEAEIFFSFLEPPYEFIFRGLAEKTPLCFDENASDSLYHHREFAGRQDLERARWSVEQIETMHRFIRRRSPSIFSNILRSAGLGGAEETLMSLCGNLLVRFGAGAKLSMDPVSEEQLDFFLREAFQDRILKADVRERFLESLIDAEEKTLMLPFWGLVFQKVQEQLSRLTPGRAVEGELLTCIRIQRSAAEVPPHVVADSGQEAQPSPRKRAARNKKRRSENG